MWFVRICLLLSLAVVSFSLLKVHIPPPKDEIYPRLRIKTLIPDMKELSSCVWMKPYSLDNKEMTLFSYAASLYDNEYYSMISECYRPCKLCFSIKGDLSICFDCPHVNWESGEWYHVCNTWFGSNGHMKTYINGRACLRNNNKIGIISPNTTVSGGGVFIIGQEQDRPDANYNKKQSFYGDIVDLNLWNEVLTEKQIIEAGKCNSRRRKGNIIAGLKTPTTALHVNISETELCKQESEYDSFP